MNFFHPLRSFILLRQLRANLFYIGLGVVLGLAFLFIGDVYDLSRLPDPPPRYRADLPHLALHESHTEIVCKTCTVYLNRDTSTYEAQP